MDPQQTKVYTAILLASIVIAIIIIYFAISLIKHQRRSLAINRQNVLSEIATLEKDRTRMAADLHDELGPLLSVIKMRINSIDVTDEDDREQQELSSKQIDEVLERLRGIARNLMPNTLVRKGLVKALEEFTNAFNQTNHLKVSFESDLSQEIDEERSINIFRVVQEICQNALKHSKASQLLIRLKESKKGIEILCEDNGVGFDYEKMLQEGKGLGLRNLKSRVEIMGGQFQIESRPNRGTQYVFDVPMTELR